MAKDNRKTLAAAVGAAFIVSASATPVLYAGENPFQMSDLGSGYQVADAHKEGGCGGDVEKEGKDKEGKCGEGKDKEGSCGEESEEKAAGEGKCGEGKCGDS